MATFDRTRARFRRNAAFAGLALAVLALVVLGAVQASSLVASSVYGEARQSAGEDARLIADLGFAAALADGQFDKNDLRAAAKEFAAARRSHPLLGVVVWSPRGDVLYTAGAAGPSHARSISQVVRAALATGMTSTAYARAPGIGATVEAAVPLAARHRRFVADYYFSQPGVEARVRTAIRRLYWLVGIGALLFYAAILPLLMRAAWRLPPPVPPAHRRARADLLRALEHDELRVHYQPKVDIETRVPVGVEALARWEHPRRGLLGPAEFLEHAERDPELLTGVTRTTLDRAVRDCAGWYRDGRNLPVAVNIAAPMLLGGLLVAAVNAALGRHDLPPHLLTLEITESAIMLRGPEAAGVLAELRAIGVRVSLDDFGTGYSSLARLRTFPLDELKIDRSFVHALTTDERVLPLVELIINLGKNFGLTVVAEGVEDALSLAVLRSVGCSVAQGFFFSAALPERDLLAWLASYRPLAGCGNNAPARSQ